MFICSFSSNKVELSILMIDYLERGKTITGVHYADQIRKLWAVIKQKRRGKLSHGVLLHQDNAPSHTSVVARAAIRECDFQLLNHPPYSPDLAPSDYHVFRSRKIHFADRNLTVMKRSSMR